MIKQSYGQKSGQATAPGPGAPSPAAGSASTGKPAKLGSRNQAVLGHFTIRDLVVFGGTLILFVTSLLPVFLTRFNLWNAGSLFFLGLGVVLPLIVSALFAARRLAPATRIRIGSLSVDQFASVVASFCLAFFFLSVTADYHPALLAGLIGAVVLFAATVLGRFLPYLSSDFLDRAEVPAHVMARESAVPLPKPHTPKAPKESEPAAASAAAGAVADSPAPAGAGSHGSSAVAGPAAAVTSAAAGSAATASAASGAPAAAGHAGPQPGTTAGTSPAASSAPAAQASTSAASAQPAASAEPAPSTASGQPAPSASTPPAANEAQRAQGAPAVSSAPEVSEWPSEGDFGPPTQAADVVLPANEAATEEARHVPAAAQAPKAAEPMPATAVHQQVRQEEPIGATVDPASRPEESDEQQVHEAFWFAVAQHRTAVDPRTGAPAFVIEPGGWVLALEDRGHEFLVQHTDGRVGVLRDLSNIERG